MRIRRRMDHEKQIEVGQKNKYKCPVYLCTSSYKEEEGLLQHYEKDHADLVQLGLSLRKSKKKRAEEKLKKAQVKAQKKMEEELGSKKDPKKKSGSVDVGQNQ